MNKLLLLCLFAFLACVLEARKIPCNNYKILSSPSPDRKWFKIKSDPSASPGKTMRLLYLNGFEEGENAFRVEPDSDQKITISAQDGSMFAIKNLKIKTKNSDKIIFTGVMPDGSGPNVEKMKIPEQYKSDPDWEITRVKFSEKLKSLVIDIKLHSTGDKRADRKLFIRGLFIKACL